MRIPTAEEAIAFAARTDFVWHQRFELAPGVSTPGVSDVDWLLDNAGVPTDLTGLSVLDIGTTNGGAAFMAERRGAQRVVAVDVKNSSWYGFDAAARLLESDVEYVRASVYELSSALEGDRFDLVLFFGVLYHLRHPLLALDNVRAVAGGEILLETAVGDVALGAAAALPVARFHRLDDLNGDGSNWFTPSVRCLLEWCGSCGFDAELVTTVGEPAVRALVRARTSDGEPEWLNLSYERPVRASVLQEERRLMTQTRAERLRAELEHVRAQLHTMQNSKLMRTTEPAREAWYRLRKRGS
jgi:tRNA (mo5U34)-methyltransferase